MNLWKTALFAFAALFFLTTMATAKEIPSDIVSLIRTHLPFISQDTITANYDLSYIEKNFPQHEQNGPLIIYKKDGEKIIWKLNETKQVEQVAFTFNLEEWKGSSAEKNLLKNYKNKITPEAYSHISSGTRTLVIEDPKFGLDLDVFFPVADSKAPLIRSVTIHKKVKSE